MKILVACEYSGRVREAFTRLGHYAMSKTLYNAPIKRICIENPVPMGRLIDHVGAYSQTIQPYMFGEDASKRTCLWLKGLPLLKPTKLIKKKIYSNQTPSGQNKLGPSPDRWKERSRTYQGIADAMAAQWGGSNELTLF